MFSNALLVSILCTIFICHLPGFNIVWIHGDQQIDPQRKYASLTVCDDQPFVTVIGIIDLRLANYRGLNAIPSPLIFGKNVCIEVNKKADDVFFFIITELQNAKYRTSRNGALLVNFCLNRKSIIISFLIEHFLFYSTHFCICFKHFPAWNNMKFCQNN